MEVDLLDFVTECRHRAKRALGSRAGEPATGGLERWVHVVVHCLRLEEEHAYRETANRLRYPADVRATLDSTFFARGHASAYYRKRADRSVETLKATTLTATTLTAATLTAATLTDTESLVVLNVHCSARWEHDIKTGRRLVRRNREVLESVTADKAFHDWQLTMDCRAHGIEPLILRRGSTLASVGHNAAIRTRGYGKRWPAETTYSTTKRTLGSALRAQSWYREFREVVLMFAVTNIERLPDPL